MKVRKNVLWIMADQLRWDYLSCYGNTKLHTPNIDRIAKMGVRFNRAYVQSPICGPSRMSFYTGRYVRSHGSTWNGIPLRIGEQTLGDHLRELEVSCVLVGKTHMVADAEGMKRLGIEPDSFIGVRVKECGFEVFERDDGLHPDGDYDPDPRYDDYLRAHGMDGDNPWEEWANSAQGSDGQLLSGWFMENAHLPARVPEEHSETAYLTSRGIDFMKQAGDQPWLCHLSYIKPHWPYLAPAPYNDMYSAEDLPPLVRSEIERTNTHPVLRAWQESRIGRSFWRDEVRERVGPVYMGLIKQLDDHVGRLLDYLEESGRINDTMIIMSSDHGDNLGDHWLGEKDLFYDCSARIPLIIYDPSHAADIARGTMRDDLIEAIDLVPTFIEYFGGNAKPHVVEGRSLIPLLEGKTTAWRDILFSEYDYSTREARLALGLNQADARLVLAFDGRWKYIHANGFRPMMFDLENDPSEFVDLGDDPAYENERQRLAAAIYDWSLRHHNRVTVTAERINHMAEMVEPPGILIGYWSPDEN
jgi:arylsulfatase A-like enzyme